MKIALAIMAILAAFSAVAMLVYLFSFRFANAELSETQLLLANPVQNVAVVVLLWIAWALFEVVRHK